MLKTSNTLRRLQRGLLTLTSTILCFGDLRDGSAAPRFVPRRPLRVAVPRLTDPCVVDPLSATGSIERLLARNLFGRLLELNEDGEVIPGLASAFEWRGSSLFFTFDHAGGEGTVSARDAALSLTRAMRVKGPRLGLCPKHAGPNRECPEFRVSGNELEISLPRGVRGERLIRALTTTAFSITSLRSTASPGGLTFTGAYRTIGLRRSGQLELSVTRPGRDEDSVFERIEFVVIPPARAARALLDQRVDLISSAYGFRLRANPRPSSDSRSTNLNFKPHFSASIPEDTNFTTLRVVQ